MKRLGKQQQARHGALAAQLASVYTAMNSAIAGFNKGVAQLHAELLVPAVQAANKVVAEANAFTTEIHDEQESYFEDRSDNWREGDAGQSYSDWMDEWDLSLDGLELESPVPLDKVPNIDVIAFERLETEVPS